MGRYPTGMSNTKRPNIIMTIADDQRYNALSGLTSGADPVVRTPHLDQLMASGTCYRRAYIPGSMHGAVCAPSRAMLHTGLTLFRTNDDLAARDHPEQELPTLGAQLGQAGYRTVGVGKWHNSDAAFRRTFQQGRGVFHGGMSSHFCAPNVDYAPDTTGRHVGNDLAGHSVDLFTKSAVESLHDYVNENTDAPLFLYIAYTAPHDPRETYYRFRKQFPLDQVPLPDAFMPEHPFDTGTLRIRDELLADFPRDPDEIRQHNADYAAILLHMDEGIGRLHAAANEAGLTSDNTLFIHTADHGLAVGRHGLMGKQSMYDHSMRPPLIVSGPGFERGVDDDRLCYMQDLCPTLLDAAQAEPLPNCDFINLRSTERRSHVGSAYADLMRMVRDDRHKLIRTHANGQWHTQLFDLIDDPHELSNLADDSQSQPALTALRDAMMNWQGWAGDQAEQFSAVAGT